MKILLGLLLLSLPLSNATAQDTTKHDPLLSPLGGYPVFANSAEIVSITDSVTGASSRVRFPRILDVSPGTLIKEGTPFAVPVSGDFNLSTDMWSDCIADDFDGDGKAEIVNAWVTPFSAPAYGRLNMELGVATRLKPSYNWTWSAGTFFDGTNWYNGPVRMVAAKLDSSSSKRIVTCCTFNDGFWLATYSWDGQSLSYRGRTDWGSGSGNAWPVYDIASGDFDGDGLDEIILVAHDIWGSSNHSLDAYTFKYNRATNQFVVQGRKGVSTTSGQWATWKRLKVTAGDFRNVGHDEAVISVTVTSGNNGRQAFNYVNTTPDAGGFLSFYATPPGNTLTGYTYGWESDAVAADIDPFRSDGDELVVAGGGEVAVLKFNASHVPYYAAGGNAKTSFLNTPLLETYERRRLLAVGDMDPDTSNAIWVPEIIMAEHKQDTTTVFRVLVPTVDATDSITGLVQKAVFAPGRKSLKSEIALGDFDGDAMHLGAPKLLTVENSYQPVVMLNVPPTHFDFLNNQVYDICKIYGAPPSQFKVKYTETDVQTKYFQSQVTHSWGLSQEFSAGMSVFGVKVTTEGKRAYDGGYYKTHGVDTTTTAIGWQEANLDDWIMATISDLDFWEYPIYAMGEQTGSFLVQVPHFRGKQWFNRKYPTADNWMADREVGNLLSYLPDSRMPSWVGDNLLVKFTSTAVTGTGSSGFDLNLATQSIDTSKLTNKFSAEVGASVKAWGIEAKTSGHYSWQKITTNVNKATDAVRIEGMMAGFDPAFGDALYMVTPYIYWGENGALVVDYSVDLPTSGGTFWSQNYQSQPDPAFILPWRLDSLKGIGGTGAKKLLCKSLHVSPMAPSAGDTVHITANVHNFSLLNTSGPVTVRFYLGNPASGGSVIVGTLGQTQLATAGSVPARDWMTVEMDWVIPSGLTNTAKLYAVIDPDNQITEIHEDNNIGFVPLNVAGATGIGDEPQPALPDQFVLHQNYPNPFNPSTVIQYEVPGRSHVRLVVYDLLGRVVATLVDEIKPAGRHNVVFDGRGIATGMYLYRINAGNFVSTKKMLTVK